jgi:type I restriction enzyme S subunit
MKSCSDGGSLTSSRRTTGVLSKDADRGNLGVDWPGDIPKDWDIVRLKRIFSTVGGGTPQSTNSEYWDGDIRWVTPNDLGRLTGDTILESERKITKEGYGSCGTTLVPAGSLILSTRAPIGHLAIAGTELCTNQGCHSLILQDSDRDYPKYHYYQLLAARPELESWGRGSTFMELSQKDLRGVYLCRPPPNEQRVIASYLDRATSKIDALIRKKHLLMETLQEKKAIIASSATTKGLLPDAAMKDSGIPAVGLIPKHWDAKKNKQIFAEVDERSVTGEEELLTISHISGVTPRSEKEVTMFMAESLEGYKICRRNDLVINTMWAWMGALGISERNGIVSPSYNVYRFRNDGEFAPKYLDLLYRTPPYICEIRRHSKGVWKSRLRLYPNSFFSIFTLKPPLSEQCKILDYVAGEGTRLEGLINKVRRSIDLLREYKNALVTAVATGKINSQDLGDPFVNGVLGEGF